MRPVPSIMDMVEVMERLESKSLHIEPAHCVRVRNRNASCSRCVDACPTQAIALSGNSLSVDSQSCIGCGSCATACPTSAIRAMKPSDAELDASIDVSSRALEGAAVAVCARVSAKRAADADAVAVVPCVSRLGVANLVGACARGASSLTVVDGVCATCKYRKAAEGFSDRVHAANVLLEAWGSTARVASTSELPQRARAQSAAQGTGGVSRRHFFSAARASVKDVAAEAVAVTVENELGIRRDRASLRAMLRVDASGTMPHVRAYAHESLMESLFEMGDPASGAVTDAGLWGDVVVDETSCVMCGMCATFCPTGALRKVFAEGEKRPVLDRLEFRVADCVACGLCEDACVRKALHVERAVDCEKILELEPRAIRGAKRMQAGGLFKR